MRRRDFISLISGAAAWPLVARAQQAHKRIGFLGTSSLSLERHLLDAFVQSLRELGHVEGESIVMSTDGRKDRTTDSRIWRPSWFVWGRM